MASHQVGGHAASFFANPDPESTGSSLIKASCPTERDFYTILGPQLTRSYWNARRTSSEILGVTEDEVEARGRSGDDGFKEERGEAFIGVWTPAFFGVLTLNSAVAPSVEGTSGVNLATKPLAPPEMLVLENLAYRFLRPNILDIKLGTRLYDADATAEKQLRMDESARATTSALTGMRFTGFQVWDSSSTSFVKTEKSYGKSLSVDQLGIALSKYLNSPPLLSTSSIALPPILAATSPLPVALIRAVVNNVLSRVRELESIMAQMEFRMIGGSLLIVYEGDEEALRSALDREVAASKSATDSLSSSRQQDDATSDAESDESASTSNSQGDALPHTRLSFDVRLIDFAHTRAATGEGPDQGVLQGLAKVRELLEGWLGENA